MRSLATIIVLLLAITAPAQTTWIVDQNNGPGTSFTDLPPAITAAQDGDRIIIRAGSYTGFATAKALTMLGEGSVNVVRPGTSLYAMSVAGLAAGKTFVMKNLNAVGGLQRWLGFTNDNGRIHLEGITATVPFSATFGIGCYVSGCANITFAGCTFEGRPGLWVDDSTVTLTSANLVGGNACASLACGPSLAASPGIYASVSRLHLSRTNVTGGQGDVSIFNSLSPAPAISAISGATIVTGDATTLISAGMPAGGTAATAAIAATGGSVALDTTVTISGTPDVAGTATVSRRRIISLIASGVAPGSALTAEVVSPAGNAVGVWASVPGDPIVQPYGVWFISLALAIPIAITTQGASEHLQLTIPLPGLPEFLGFPLAFQAAEIAFPTGLTLSNPAIVVLA